MRIRRRPTILARDKDGYVPGSIQRVKLHNFLTYDDVEFRPGPYLNMVLGPNGTGKSSIACALCLGLNWPPSVLGRASKLGSFVKLGKSDGFIEIELKGPIGEHNLVIRRNLTSGMTSQQAFTLNGTQTPGKEISARVEGLGIQINNLCSFLPQDKVAEFAQMSPQQLLRATQKAAGDGQLLKWHDSLIELGQELKDVSSKCAIERREVETLEQRNATLEREVSAYKNRRRIEREIELLELILPFKEYLNARNDYDTLKKRRAELHEKALNLKKRSQPVHDYKGKLAKNKEKADAEREGCRTKAKKKFEAQKPLWKKSEDLSAESDKIADDLTALKNQEKKRRTAIQTLKNDIHKLEHEIAHPPETEDMETINADFRANQQELNTAEMEKHEMEGEIRPFVDESAQQDIAVRRATEALLRLDSASHRKLEAFRNWDRAAGDVVAWLRQNKHQFKKEVIEPAALSVDVKDGRYASAVESAFSAMQLKTFVFLCDEDHRKFNRLIIDTNEGMGRRCKVATWYRPERQETVVPPPMSREELKQQGFDAYGLDLVTYPEGMRWFLLDEIKLHRFAIGLNSSRIDMQSAMEMVTRNLPNGRPGSGSFVIGNVLSMVSRSRYGQRKPFNNTRDIQPAKSFRSAPVDQERKRAIEVQIREAQTLKEEAESKISELNQKIKDKDTRVQAILSEKMEIEKRRKAVLDIQRRLQTMKLRLDDKRRALQKEENAPSLEEKRATLRKKGFDYAKQRLTIARQLKELTMSSLEDSHTAALAGLRFLQIGANIDALEQLIKTHDTQYEKAMQDYNTIDQEYNEMKAITKAKLMASKKKLEEIDDELRQTFMEKDESGEVQRMSVEDIEQDLANLRAQLELNLATNAGVIETYERRQREIEQRTRILENKEKRRSDLERKLQKTRGKWLPALQELVNNINEKFSAAFDRVNCAGEIRIAEHPDDYTQWAIDILVKFRNSENLQLLTGQRQSGGERALTTIMYLMSLTELARAPFSLVDEINQGMDAQYERAVHNSLVEVTCQPDSGQYFLITPKLLTDLKYHERMKVLCVSNGEWLPDEQLDGNMMRMIDSFVAHRDRVRAR
ncbi:P-loop containing nucleoside triphosphate hydrolase protein [Fomitiporia mediterranea MF3/22]|uniref:P-loop containing nucleoside triphosphate hydrolase protein n=1 Tax=Fomitiporia mediterranea (strain MF3/22) TaxID=694068 RepID=UPI0004408913|nr:P-loop containing nucleoside triphosphate hydrolase protein [Fomitiporia mediterranea MF3/22]EJD01702.1 P-loop containing nucleoside triphosphate hydrolase protein [Fomitiporia mediterranea MF3/22]